MAVFLTPDRVRDEYGLKINEKIIPDGSRVKPNRKLTTGTPQWVTIHNTDRIKVAAGTTQSEQYARATMNGNMNGVSVHYYIDDADCWQILKEDEIGYHAADGYWGKGNCTTLAIEIIMDGSGKDYDKAAENRGALLAAILLHRYNLPVERLTNHNHWYSEKYCPAYILPHWDEFRRKVKIYLEQLNHGGDIDGDGKVTAADARLALRASVGSEKLTDMQKAAADVDGDGKVTSADAREILRKSVGLEG